MIQYDNSQFWTILFRLNGTVFAAIIMRCMLAVCSGLVAAYLNHREIIGMVCVRMHLPRLCSVNLQWPDS